MDEFNRRPRRPIIDLSGYQASYMKRRSSASEPGLKPKPIAYDHTLEAPEPHLQLKPPKKSWLRLPKTRKEWVILGIPVLLLIVGGGWGVYNFFIKSAPVAQEVVEEVKTEPEVQAPTTVPSKLSGRQVDPTVNDRGIYAVQIENSAEARPQSGLYEADMVFEAVAEGGITRFNALFHDNQPATIGPVRSLRPYYIDWFWPFDAAIVHAGGSAEALNDVKVLGLKDLDHGPNGNAFKRVTHRYAPHNLYTSASALNELMVKKGFTSSTFTSLPRKETAPASTPSASVIDLKISSALYNVTYNYDAATNTYLRSQGGTPHKDAESGTQIAPTVIVVPIMSKGIHSDRQHTVYGTVGSGKVYVFQDGTVTEGTWQKASRQSQWQLTDLAGATISLNPGQTWFTMLDSASNVSYRP